jgi:transcriptional regulator with XRE-family HTH domain
MTTPQVDGQSVRKVRKALNLSGADLCRKVEEAGQPLSRSHLCQIENGTKQPSQQLARAIATALGVEPNTLTASITRVVVAVEFGSAA